MSKWKKQIELFCKNNSFEKYERAIEKLFIQETFKSRARHPCGTDNISSNFTWSDSEQGVDFWVRIDMNKKLIQTEREFFEEILRPHHSVKLIIFELEV